MIQSFPSRGTIVYLFIYKFKHRLQLLSIYCWMKASPTRFDTYLLCATFIYIFLHIFIISNTYHLCGLLFLRTILTTFRSLPFQYVHDACYTSCQNQNSNWFILSKPYIKFIVFSYNVSIYLLYSDWNDIHPDREWKTFKITHYTAHNDVVVIITRLCRHYFLPEPLSPMNLVVFCRLHWISRTGLGISHTKPPHPTSAPVSAIQLAIRGEMNCLLKFRLCG